MLLVFRASRKVSFNDDNHILKFFTEGFENLPSSFFFNSKNLLSSIEQCTWLHFFTSCSGSFIQTFATRWQIKVVLLFHIKQILILARTVFVELIYLSCDLKTINCRLADHSIWIKFIFKFVRLLHKAGICSACIGPIICKADFPCFSRRTPPHF